MCDFCLKSKNSNGAKSAEKMDEVSIQSRSCLLLLLQTEQCEHMRYAGARAHLPSDSLCVSI